MCTSSEISVTTNSIITARPSIWMPTPNSTPPFCHHVTWWTTGVTTGFAVATALGAEHAAAERARGRSRDRRWRLDPVDPLVRPRRTTSTNDAPSAAMPTSAPFFGKRFPKNRIRTNDTAGIAG